MERATDVAELDLRLALARVDREGKATFRRVSRSRQSTSSSISTCAESASREIVKVACESPSARSTWRAARSELLVTTRSGDVATTSRGRRAVR